MTRAGKRHPLMSPQAFAEYGCGAVGYVRQMRSEEADLPIRRRRCSFRG